MSQRVDKSTSQSFMQVILQKNVSNLGLVGDAVEVKPGYYRNFLAPRALAMLANPGSLKQAEHQKRLVEAQKAKQKSTAVEVQQKIEAAVIALPHAAGSGDKLFGSITTQEIFNALRGAGFEVDRKQIKLEAPIKTLGAHLAEVKLHPEVIAKVRLEVIRKQEETKKEEADASGSTHKKG